MGIVAALLILAGCINILNRECPSSCNDGNICTDDYCGADTNYKCVNKPLSGSQPACSGSVTGAPCAVMACDSGTCVTKTSRIVVEMPTANIMKIWVRVRRTVKQC